MRSFVAENPIEEQVKGNSVVDTEESCLFIGLLPRGPRFAEPDMSCEGGEDDGLIDPVVFVENCVPESIKAESSTTLPFYRYRDASLFTFNNLLQARGTVSDCVVSLRKSTPNSP